MGLTVNLSASLDKHPTPLASCANVIGLETRSRAVRTDARVKSYYVSVCHAEGSEPIGPGN